MPKKTKNFGRQKIANLIRYGKHCRTKCDWLYLFNIRFVYFFGLFCPKNSQKMENLARIKKNLGLLFWQKPF